jgi:GH15 family glucan-1,4-alpha-glucosidase
MSDTVTVVAAEPLFGPQGVATEGGQSAATVEAAPKGRPDEGEAPADLRLDHGAIGNGRVLALIGPDTSVDWLCLPRFDSPSIFGRLLDTQKGGSFALEPVPGSRFRTRMSYVANTNVLQTVVTVEGPDGEGGEFEVFDYAPRVPQGLGVHAPLELHRVILPRPGGGNPRFRVRLDPRPDYARTGVELVPTGTGLEIRPGSCSVVGAGTGGVGGSACDSLHLRTDVPVQYLLNGQAVRVDQGRYFVLSYGRPTEEEGPFWVRHTLDLTVAGWRSWAKTCALPGFHPEAVLRSALVLKLHAYVDTGAIIAAATTSIPEAPRTERTWDYRFCWLRDAAFTVEALRRLGHLAEGEAFVRFLRDVAEAGPLQPVYGIGGERDLTERHLDHLSGFAGGRPVRIGNAAYAQKQNDLMGELVLCLESVMTDPRVVCDDPDGLMRLVERLVEEAVAVAPSTDMGIWEFRTLLRHYTFSKALCWTAAHRGARLARRLGRTELADRWGPWADRLREQILTEGYNAELGIFTQALQGRYPDASNLLLATIGLVDPRDPRFVSTVERYGKTLVENGLMLRYRNTDDFGETTSAFSICSFWWAEALAMAGRLDEAVEVFERMLKYANPVGLFSEDIEPADGRLMGNFPQAYTHVGLINAAVTIGELLAARDGRFRAWC